MIEIINYFILFSFILSFVIDIVFGELPSKIHPVVLIGSSINYFKKLFIKINNRISGLLVTLTTFILLCIISMIIYFISSYNQIILFIVYSILLSSTFSVKMLLSTAVNVENDLKESIDKARQSVSYLVSRSTDELTESFIVSAVIESLSENITDSYVAVVFYYFILSFVILYFHVENGLYYLLLAALSYRMFNTLDAMLGYKTDELKNIGFVPAKIDDILNFIPSRIAGLFVVISAYILRLDGKNSYMTMMRDARKCPSPNSGYTMASTAGALNIQLVKKGTYILGDRNKEITSSDISKAVELAKMTIILFTITIILLYILINVII